MLWKPQARILVKGRENDVAGAKAGRRRTMHIEDARNKLTNPKLSLKKAIRNKCLDCTNFLPTEVKLCGDKKCPLWQFRNGKVEEIKKRGRKSNA